MLRCHDPSSSIEALTANLVAFLAQEGELEDELIVAAAVEGEMTFVAQALVAPQRPRGRGCDGRIPVGRRQAADGPVPHRRSVSRQSAASLLAAIGDLLGINDPGRAIDAYNRLSEAEVEDARNWLSTDPAYRSAAASLGKADG